MGCEHVILWRLLRSDRVAVTHAVALAACSHPPRGSTLGGICPCWWRVANRAHRNLALGDRQLSGRSDMLSAVTLMAYVDETGDTGSPLKQGSSSCYVLGCILIESDDWPSAFDELLKFRSVLSQNLGIPMRAELKANYLIRNGGPLRKLGLSTSQRQYVYRESLKVLNRLPARAFAIVTDKSLVGTSGQPCFDLTWEMLLQRLERTCSRENKSILITHDEGDNASVRRLVRRARRHLTAGSAFGTGRIQNNAHRILDDPIPRDSQHSYVIQLADLVAYAGWRTHIPPSKSVAQVVPQSMWSHVGLATHEAVNSRSLNWSVPGVVLRTK